MINLDNLANFKVCGNPSVQDHMSLLKKEFLTICEQLAKTMGNHAQVIEKLQQKSAKLQIDHESVKEQLQEEQRNYSMFRSQFLKAMSKMQEKAVIVTSEQRISHP